jgi:hypothetical protein
MKLYQEQYSVFSYSITIRFFFIVENALKMHFNILFQQMLSVLQHWRNFTHFTTHLIITRLWMKSFLNGWTTIRIITGRLLLYVAIVHTHNCSLYFSLQKRRQHKILPGHFHLRSMSTFVYYLCLVQYPWSWEWNRLNLFFLYWPQHINPYNNTDMVTT